MSESQSGEHAPNNLMEMLCLLRRKGPTHSPIQGIGEKSPEYVCVCVCVDVILHVQALIIFFKRNLKCNLLKSPVAQAEKWRLFKVFMAFVGEIQLI